MRRRIKRRKGIRYNSEGKERSSVDCEKEPVEVRLLGCCRCGVCIATLTKLISPKGDHVDLDLAKRNQSQSNVGKPVCDTCIDDPRDRGETEESQADRVRDCPIKNS